MPSAGSRLSRFESDLLCQPGHSMPTSAGFIDVLSSEADETTRQTIESFGYEWTTFSRIESEDEAFWEVYFRDVPLDQIEDAIALDAGCGKGRFTYFLAPHVRALEALDASAATETAAAIWPHSRMSPSFAVICARCPSLTRASISYAA